jgi:hypothetical protein
LLQYKSQRKSVQCRRDGLLQLFNETTRIALKAPELTVSESRPHESEKADDTFFALLGSWWEKIGISW